MPDQKKFSSPLPPAVRIEVKADAWGRFEHAVDAAVKSGPKHRAKIVPPKRRKPKQPKPK